jgi:hypothetical protein
MPDGVKDGIVVYFGKARPERLQIYTCIEQGRDVFGDISKRVGLECKLHAKENRRT